MAKFFYVALFLLPLFVFAQTKDPQTKGNIAAGKEKKVQLTEPAKNDTIATIDMYKIITLQHDNTYVDTSLTIQKECKFNYLRKDNVGLLPFANEGQTFNTLDYSYNKTTAYPGFGFAGKHFNYLEVDDIKYYNVATPMTDLYFKAVMEQGQMIDAFITLNTSERLNFSIGYRGLRSLGKYVNQLSSNGNFKFMTSYNTLNERYFLKAHFTGQDINNGEKGGIVNLEDCGDDDSEFDNRARLDVYFLDATSILKGNRYFVDHHFRINANKSSNNHDALSGRYEPGRCRA